MLKISHVNGKYLRDFFDSSVKWNVMDFFNRNWNSEQQTNKWTAQTMVKRAIIKRWKDKTGICAVDVYDYNNM